MKKYSNQICGEIPILSQAMVQIFWEEIRKALPDIVKEINAESFLDVPCGDFFWMQHVDLPVKKYLGADIVREIVAKNNQRFKNEKREFIFLDITKDDLPKVDVIFCRDCLPHLDFSLIRKAIKQLQKSGSKYLITSTYILTEKNIDKPLGIFRPLNFQLPPFKFPQTLRLLSDKYI